MSVVEETTDAKPQAAGVELPGALRARFNGELDGETVVAWSEFDLDSANRYAKHFAVLTDAKLIVLTDARVHLPVAQIEEAKIVEGLGVDQLNVIVGGKLAAELRYSRRFRRDMTRL